ncbi:hypothetical protein PPE04_00760 [Pediococcus pentosaceus]|nr:hypothetical protein PPE04_00760 [Pediococcus pentosaceus]
MLTIKPIKIPIKIEFSKVDNRVSSIFKCICFTPYSNVVISIVSYEEAENVQIYLINKNGIIEGNRFRMVFQ